MFFLRRGMTCGFAASLPSVFKQKSCTVLCQEEPKPRPEILSQLDSIGLNNHHMSIFDRSGQRVSLGAVVRAATEAEVVFIGETHNDPVAHQVELLTLMALHHEGPCALSMEMFESDVQDIIDEYLAGLIEEEDFLRDARPWKNYMSDYRYAVEFAKEMKMPVVAANLPQRYVKALMRQQHVGEDDVNMSTSNWPASAFEFLPDLLTSLPSKGYLEHIAQDLTSRQTKAGCPYVQMNRKKELTSALMGWDCAMAESIAHQLSSNPERKVVHICGSFHCEQHLGTVEMLAKCRESKVLVVVVYPEDDCHGFDSGRHGTAADFVILTDSSLPRSTSHDSE